MPVHYANPVLSCDNCGATRERPVTKGVGLEAYKNAWQAFHASGWRMVTNPHEQPSRLLPRTSLVSCPDCPAVEPGDPTGRYRAAGSTEERAPLLTAEPATAPDPA